MTVTETLQKEIESTINGTSMRELERRAGISHGSLNRFLDGSRGINAATLDKVCTHLKLELRPIESKAKVRANLSVKKRR